MMKNPLEKYARIDSATGRGMNVGFCVNDGVAYFESKSDLIAYLRQDLIERVVISDDELLDEAYDDETYYYTEWEVEDEDTYFIEVNGEWLEVINAKVN
jgi:hypothetical protein